MNEKKSLRETELYESRFHYKEDRSNMRFLTALILIFLVLFCAMTSWKLHFGGVQVSGGSMLNTLHNGDYLLMEYYQAGEELEYGSVIVLDIEHYFEVQEYNRKQKEKNPAWQDTKFVIKRLIAKEGDRVRCRQGVVEVWYDGADGYQVLDEPYITPSIVGTYSFTEYVVGEGEIFFLGDNRNISMDSRYHEGQSHLNRLYKETDVCGVVPDWAIKNKDTLEKIFFWREKLGKN